MPVLDDKDELRRLAMDGVLRFITIDTSIFHQKSYRIEKEPLISLNQFSDSFYSFILSNVTFKELEAHMIELCEQKRTALHRTLGDAFSTWNVTGQDPGAAIHALLSSDTPDEHVSKRLKEFTENTGCRIVESNEFTSLDDLFSMYFRAKPPFGKGKKKSEFPDAACLLALENFAKTQKLKILAISTDTDWKSFCELSDVIYFVDTLELGLSILQRPDDGFISFLAEVSEASTEFQDKITNAVRSQVERWDFDVRAVSSAQIECHVDWKDVKDVFASDLQNIDIILQNQATGVFHASAKALIFVELDIGLEFYAWDSMDKEEVLLTSKNISKEIEIHASIVFEVSSSKHEMGKREFTLLSVQVEPFPPTIDLGYIEPFEPDDDST